MKNEAKIWYAKQKFVLYKMKQKSDGRYVKQKFQFGEIKQICCLFFFLRNMKHKHFALYLHWKETKISLRKHEKNCNSNNLSVLAYSINWLIPIFWTYFVYTPNPIIQTVYNPSPLPHSWLHSLALWVGTQYWRVGPDTAWEPSLPTCLAPTVAS